MVLGINEGISIKESKNSGIFFKGMVHNRTQTNLESIMLNESSMPHTATNHPLPFTQGTWNSQTPGERKSISGFQGVKGGRSGDVCDGHQVSLGNDKKCSENVLE